MITKIISAIVHIFLGILAILYFITAVTIEDCVTLEITQNHRIFYLCIAGALAWVVYEKHIEDESDIS